jgi:hypothetical protein
MQDWFPRTPSPSTAPPADETPTVVRQAAPGKPPAATFAGPASHHGHAVPLADAFAALLAAEHGAPPPPPQFIPADEKALEAIVARVLERMAAQRVPEIVTRVAERLVREEIARIKNAG